MKKKKYEKPILTSFDVNLSFGSPCRPGSSATQCNLGSVASNNCNVGSAAGNPCNNGTAAANCGAGTSVM